MKFLLISFVYLIFFLKNGNYNSDELYWSKTRQLAWSDFQGKSPDSTVLSAAVSVKLKLSYEISKKLICVKLICFLAKKESWYKDTTNYALNHEQTHFNIGELTARLMRKQMDSLSRANTRVSINEIKTVFESYSNKLKEMQDLYDTETNHSLNFDAEISWESMILEKLDKLKEFEDLYKEFSFMKSKR